LAHIPKGVLEKIRKTCLKFPWKGGNGNVGFHLAKWQTIAKPKEEGDWGLKHDHVFGKPLAAKS